MSLIINTQISLFIKSAPQPVLTVAEIESIDVSVTAAANSTANCTISLLLLLLLLSQSLSLSSALLSSLLLQTACSKSFIDTCNDYQINNYILFSSASVFLNHPDQSLNM